MNMVLSKDNYVSSLFSRLHTFQRDRLLCDGIIKIADKQFSIHKVILSAASPYFCSLFCNGMSETFLHEVELQGVSSEGFSFLLDYIYSGNINVTSNNVEQLLEAGKLFYLDDLVEHCCEFLISELTVDNSLGILSFAELHFCTDLSKTVLNYVHRHFEDVCKTEEFLQLDWSILLSFLKSDSINIPSEDDVFVNLLKWTKHDIKNRRKYIKQLLSHVKLPLVSSIIVQEHCALFEDAGPMIYEAYSTCLQDQQCCEEFRCRRTYSRRYLYVIGGQAYNQGTVDLISLADVERCEVPRQSDDVNCFQLLQTNKVQPMNQPRNGQEVVFLDGLIYAIGGEEESFVHDSVECYDPIADKWTVKASLLSPRVEHGACVVDGDIYVVGGWIGEEIALTMEKYNSDEDIWVEVGRIPTPRYAAGVCQVNGLIYIIGGVDVYGEIQNTADCYDPVRERWSSISSMLHSRAWLSVVSNGNYVYAIGGKNMVNESSVERYDVEKNQWEELASLPYTHRNASAACVDNSIYVVGGTKDTTMGPENLNYISCYDMTQDKWANVGQLHSKLTSAAAVIV